LPQSFFHGLHFFLKVVFFNCRFKTIIPNNVINKGNLSLKLPYGIAAANYKLILSVRHIKIRFTLHTKSKRYLFTLNTNITLSDQSLFLLAEGDEIIMIESYANASQQANSASLFSESTIPQKKYPVVVCVAGQLTPEQRLKLDEIILAVKQAPGSCLIVQGVKKSELSRYKAQASKAFWSFGIEYSESMGQAYVISIDTPYIYSFPPLSEVMENINIKKAVWRALQKMIAS
jgi:DNA polymerase III psi subunit